VVVENFWMDSRKLLAVLSHNLKLLLKFKIILNLSNLLKFLLKLNLKYLANKFQMDFLDDNEKSQESDNDNIKVI
jgi:hypothetical protein